MKKEAGYSLKRKLGLVPHFYDKNRKGYGAVGRATATDVRSSQDATKARATSGFPGPIMRVELMKRNKHGGYTRTFAEGYSRD